MADTFYFRQLLSGRDFARTDQVAQQMVNFSYLIGDRAAGECLVVDPAYDVDGLLAAAEKDGMRVVGALVTHYHPDHCGGSMMGIDIQGVAALLDRVGVPIHVQRAESEWVTKVTGLGDADLAVHDPGDVVTVGSVPVELLHTPGHTPGSQCFLVNGCLVSGDTLFLEGCGRTDLPGGDPEALYHSLTTTLSKVPDDAVLFPGHQYSIASSALMGDTRATNFVFRPKTPEQWLAMFGGG
jgi:hydroxyacylglutathione hydrolase